MSFSSEPCGDSRQLLVLAVAAAVWLARDAQGETLGRLAAFFTVLGDILALFALQPEPEGAACSRPEAEPAPPLR